MFCCAHCKRTKPDSERSSLGWLGKIGFIFVAKVPLEQTAVCGHCCKKARLLGLVGVIIMAGALYLLHMVRGDQDE